MQTRGRQIEANKKEFIGYEQLTIRISPAIKSFLDSLPKWNKGDFVRTAIQEKMAKEAK